jgi:hypothetical protein
MINIPAMSVDKERDPLRFSAALRLVIRRYIAQVRRRPMLSIPACSCPASVMSLSSTHRRW